MTIKASHQFDAFKTACRQAGLRLTPQRIEIFLELANATDHPTAETLYQRLSEKMPTLSLDTVYRTLGTLVDHGMVSKVETVESQGRYEVVRVDHHHLVCEKCKHIMDFHWQFIDEAKLPEVTRSWGHIKRKSLVAYGICNKCLKK